MVNNRKLLVGAVAFVIYAVLVSPANPAFAGKSTNCVEKKNTMVDITGPDGARCVAFSDGTGTAHSKASGSGSYAEAGVSHEGGSHGKANATAKAGGSAVAGGDGGHATAISTGASSSSGAQSFEGAAKSVSSSGGTASTLTQGNCKADANSTGSGSFAYAECSVAKITSTAVATGGGNAQVTDSIATCTANGGTAVVTGNGHSCHDP